MSEDESKGEEELKGEEEGETDSGDKGEEDPASEEGEEGKDEEKQPPKKRGRKAPAGSPSKKAKKEKGGAEGGTKKKRKPAKKHPKTMDMVIEAIDNMAEKRGSSVQAIKAYILQNFKTVRSDMIKSMLRRALHSGLQQGIVARPKGQAETQVMSGRYLLGKSAKMEDEDEVMPQQSKRAQEAMLSKMKKKGGKKGKKSAKRSGSSKKKRGRK